MASPITHSNESAAPAAGELATLFLTDADVRGLADWRASASALCRAYGAKVDPQSVAPRSMARGSGMWLRSLTAISPLEGLLGCKLIAASPRIRRASYLVALFDPQSMRLCALLDGNQITGIRTASTAAVAVDALAPRRPLRVAVLGSGFEARGQLLALAAIRKVQSARVFSPTPANRQRFANELQETLRLPIVSALSAQEAVAGADVVLCAARSHGEVPILQANSLEPGMTVVSVGSTLPEQREIDTDVIERAHAIIADMPEEVARDTGDLLAATRAGISFEHKLVPLTDLIGGRRAARASPSDIVLYKSVGSALQDVVIAEMLLARAQQRGIGTPLPVSIEPVAK